MSPLAAWYELNVYAMWLLYCRETKKYFSCFSKIIFSFYCQMISHIVCILREIISLF